jgi:hypothetical protein
MAESISEAPAPTSPLSIEHARAEDAAAWDAFVENHPEGRYCHLWGFRQPLEKSCGYDCVYLKILSSGTLVGIFPAIKLRRRRRLVSQPFNEYGGPLTLALSPDQNQQLTNLLIGELRQQQCKSIEIRGGIGCDAAARDGGWKKQPLHAYAVLGLGDPDWLWKKVITYEARKAVNKARETGLTSEIRRGHRAVAGPFYELYLLSMKRLGVPPHSRSYFEEFATGIGDRVVACWILEKDQPAAILLGASTGSRVHIFVIASQPEVWAKRPADLAHWELIQWACQQGFKVFDFGSARYEGQIHFKKKWGVTLYDYGFYLIGPPETINSLKVESVKTSSWSMNAMSNLWRGSVPILLTRLLGPPIRKYLTK